MAREARKLLAQCLILDSEFEAFCIDYYPEVARNLGTTQDRLQKENILLQIADPAEIIFYLQENYPHRIKRRTNTAVPNSGNSDRDKVFLNGTRSRRLFGSIFISALVATLLALSSFKVNDSNSKLLPIFSLTINGFSKQDTDDIRSGIHKKSRMHFTDIDGANLKEIVQNIEQAGHLVDYIIVLDQNGHGVVIRKVDLKPQFEWRSLGIKWIRQNEKIEKSTDQHAIAQITQEIELAVREVLDSFTQDEAMIPACVNNSIDWVIDGEQGKNYLACRANDDRILIFPNSLPSISINKGFLKGRRAEAPEVVPGTAEVRGSLDKDIIRRIFNRSVNEQARYCYERYLQDRIATETSVRVQFTIANTGKVATALIIKPNSLSKACEDCITSSIRRVVFPRPQGGIVNVEMPLPLVQIETVLKNFFRDHQRELRPCYWHIKSSEGFLKLKFDIDKSGNIVDVLAEDSDLEKNANICMVEIARKWKLPYSFIDPVAVNYTYRFAFMR